MNDSQPAEKATSPPGESAPPHLSSALASETLASSAGPAGSGPAPGSQAERAAALVARLKARDGTALAELYDLFGATIYSLALRVVRIPGDAEEVTQEVFLYAWDRAGTFDVRRGGVATWLGTVARSRSIDRLRSQKSQQRRRDGLELEVAASGSVPQTLPDHDAYLGETRQQVRQALAGLSPEQRQVIEIAYFEGMSQSEIAELLQAPLGTVKTRMRQGMIKLKSLLAGTGGLAELL